MLEKSLLHKLNNSLIFLLSLVACAFFYGAEGILGIDRFYHPDSLYYLSDDHDVIKPFFETIKSKPLDIFPWGYVYFSNIFGRDYTSLIIVNFIIYSITNVLIYHYILKRLLKEVTITQGLLIIYLLFFDPYRMHLVCHILKETLLIFFLVFFIFYKNIVIRFIVLFLLEYFRRYSVIYLLVFIFFKDIKKVFLKLYNKINNLKAYLFFGVSIIFVLMIVTINFSLIENLFNKFLTYLAFLHGRPMPIREYDMISNFQSLPFYQGFIIKNLAWPLMMVTGFFGFFTKSILFQILGFFIFINHLIIYYVTKKSFLNFGLILIFILLSMYTTSYTAMYRYCYVSIFIGIVYFFYNLKVNEKK